jgi:hypothetical protein
MRNALMHLFLICLLLTGFTKPAKADNCTYSGTDVPAATFALGANNIYNNTSVDLAIGTNRVEALKLFYASGGQQFAIVLPPASTTPPNQTYTVPNLRTSTTFILVAKRGSSAAICTLTVQYFIQSSSVTTVPAGQDCPQGYAINGWGSGYPGTNVLATLCIRVVPNYDTTTYPDTPPGTFGSNKTCEPSGYMVNWSGGASVCRYDNTASTNGYTTLGTFLTAARNNCTQFAPPNAVSFIVSLQQPFVCAWRHTEMVGSAADDQTAAQNAQTYASS